MPLDISAFRSIASQSPDKFVYAQNQTLKASRSATKHGAPSYAAADAFIKACSDHYGKRMADAIKKYLASDGNEGKPLTARKVKALVAFADEKMGSATRVGIGGTAFSIEKVGLDKMKRVGSRFDTKISNAQEGQRESAADVLAAFKPDADGKLDFKQTLRHINTFREYIGRELAVNGHQGDEARVARLFEKDLFLAIDAMDNNELSAVYQGLISDQTDGMKKELNRILNHPDAKPSVRRLAERMFADISRIEAMAVSEISRRMNGELVPDERLENEQTPMERYVGENVESANNYGGAKDMSTLNLGIMARSAAEGANKSKVASEKTNVILGKAGMDELDAKKIGDMMRSQELTINVRFSTFMGKRRDGSQGTPMLQRPNARVMNVFESLEEQNIDTEGTGELRHRSQVEKCFFPEYGEKPLAGKDRPVYGALNLSKRTSGAADTNQCEYGRVVVVMKPHVKRHCTYALNDTFLAANISLPEERRAEIEQSLIDGFASQLKDPAAALADLTDENSEVAHALDVFFKSFGDEAVKGTRHHSPDIGAVPECASGGKRARGDERRRPRVFREAPLSREGGAGEHRRLRPHRESPFAADRLYSRRHGDIDAAPAGRPGFALRLEWNVLRRGANPRAGPFRSRR